MTNGPLKGRRAGMPHSRSATSVAGSVASGSTNPAALPPARGSSERADTAAPSVSQATTGTRQSALPSAPSTRLTRKTALEALARLPPRQQSFPEGSVEARLSDSDVEEMLRAAEQEQERPPPPRLPGWPKRPRRQAWTCPVCQWTTTTKWVPQQKRAHLLAWHPEEIASSSSLRP